METSASTRLLRATWTRPQLLKALSLIIMVALAILLPLTGESYLIGQMSRILVFAILAVSLDFVLGYGGMVSFGHAAYFGAGAYATAAWMLSGSDNGFLHLVSAVGAGALLALLIGLLCARTASIYFIMLTFAFAQMVYFFAVGQQQFGGYDGTATTIHSRFATLLDLRNSTHFYYFALCCLVLVLLLLSRVVDSRFGLVLQAARQNTLRLQTLGASPYPYLVVAFTIGGAVAGLAGFLVVNLNAYISPNFLDWKVSGDLIMMIVIGGVGTLYGGVLGAFVFLVLQELLSAYTEHWMLYFGPALVLVALYWKRGLAGLFARRYDK